MIKLTFCLKRLPHLSRAEFQAYWRETHAPLVKSHAATLGIARYVQSHALPESGTFPLAAVRGSAGQDFDGVAELWWADMATFAAAGATPEGRAAGQLLIGDEARFIDLPNSPIFLVEEHEVVGWPQSPTRTAGSRLSWANTPSK
jgi:uncharacterized protein (TIGR02118 family)